MILMWILAAAVVLSVVPIVRWGSQDLQQPWDLADPGPVPWATSLARYVWYLTVLVVAGLAAGLVMIGAGGRLAMRILAVTSPTSAQGRVTEADQIVGQITLDGTLSFILFFGIVGGLFTAALYLLAQRWLPRGRLGGLTFGVLLLVLFATRIEPLRADNVDFSIVGPGSLSVAIFVAMGLLHGMLLAALAGRISKSLPLPRREKKALIPHLPVLLLLPPVFPAVAAVGVGAIYLLSNRISKLRSLGSSRNFQMAGWVALGIATAIALPSFVSAILDIAGRP